MNVLLDAVGDHVLKLFDEEGRTKNGTPSTRLGRKNRRDRMLSEKKSRGRSTRRSRREGLKRSDSTDSSYDSASSNSVTETLVTGSTSLAARTNGTSVAQSTIGSRECLWLKHQRSSSRLSVIGNERLNHSSSFIPPTTTRRRDASNGRPLVPRVTTPLSTGNAAGLRTTAYPTGTEKAQAITKRRSVSQPKSATQANSLFYQPGSTGTNITPVKLRPEKSVANSPAALPLQGSKPPKLGASSLRVYSDNSASVTRQTPNEAPLASQRNHAPPAIDFDARQCDETADQRNIQASSPTRLLQPNLEEEEDREDVEVKDNIADEMIVQVDDLVARVQEAETQGRLYMQELKNLQMALKELDQSRSERGDEAMKSGEASPREMENRVNEGKRSAFAYPLNSVKGRFHWFSCGNIIPDCFAPREQIFRSYTIDSAYYSPEEPSGVFHGGHDTGSFYAAYEQHVAPFAAYEPPAAPSSQSRRAMFHPDHLMVPQLDVLPEDERVAPISAQNPYHQRSSNQRVVTEHPRRYFRYSSTGTKEGGSYAGDLVTTNMPNEPRKMPSFEGRTIVIYPMGGQDISKRESAVNMSYRAHPRYSPYPVM